MTDEKIMQMVSKGDLDKLSILFDRYQLRLYNFFYRLCYDQTLSEDLTQNVFERLIRYRKTFDGKHSFKSWVFQIARNVRTDNYSKNRLRLANGVDVTQLKVTGDNVAEAIDQRESMQNLEQAMAQLPEDQREILYLTRFQKLKYQEVAAMLNCSEGAVKVRVHRAIKSLRSVYFKIDSL